MADTLYQSKLIGSVFFVILHDYFFELLFGLGKCSFWMISWQFSLALWRPQNSQFSQTPFSFHRLSRPWKVYLISPKLLKTFKDCANPVCRKEIRYEPMVYTAVFDAGVVMVRGRERFLCLCVCVLSACFTHKVISPYLLRYTSGRAPTHLA